MYLASFDFAGRPIVQAKVALPPVGIVAANRFRPAMEAVFSTLPGLPPLSIAMRLEFRNRALRQSWTLTADRTAEAALRRFVSEFTRLERLAGVGAEFAMDADHFDHFDAPFPAARCRVNCSEFTRGGAQFACAFHLTPQIDRLIAEAAVRDVDCAFQVQLAANHADAAFLRQSLLNVETMRDLPGIHDAAIEHQARLARRAAAAPWVVEEIAGCEAAHADWLSGLLDRLFHEQFAAAQFAAPDFRACDDAVPDDELDSGLHRDLFEPIPAIERCGSAVDSVTALSMLTWSPGPSVLHLLPRLPPEPPAAAASPPPTPLPTPRPPGGSYRFISYAHADQAVVEKVVQAAREQGIGLWWDHQIPGGSEWDAHLEQQIDSASAVVLFLSQAAIDSKYVRREIKYADCIGKPILAVELDQFQLRHGLGMLLNQYQRVSVTRDNLMQELQRIGG